MDAPPRLHPRTLEILLEYISRDTQFYDRYISYTQDLGDALPYFLSNTRLYPKGWPVGRKIIFYSCEVLWIYGGMSYHPSFLENKFIDFCLVA